MTTSADLVATVFLTTALLAGGVAAILLLPWTDAQLDAADRFLGLGGPKS